MGDNDGHRKRLRAKFLNNGFDGFLDYEVIELLLTLGIPRKDCKPIAKDLIEKFGSVNGVLNANDDELTKFKGLGGSSIIGIKLAREIAVYSSKEKLAKENQKTHGIEEIAELANKEIGFLKKEIFKIYCINTRGAIISNTVSMGILDSSIVHPREVFKLAIDNNASSIIVAHNHPSGDTTPSEDDIYTTRKLVESGKILGIELNDHIIVSNNRFSSLLQLGYI